MSYTNDVRDDKQLLLFLAKQIEEEKLLRRIGRLGECDEQEWRSYEREKSLIWREMREVYVERACDEVKSNYQAPSFRYSLWSEAGKREGKILGNINDYTRDQHEAAHKLEKELMSVYQPRGVKALVTSSGMAALTTIRLALQRAGIGGKVAIGEESYFQNREQLKGIKVEVFDETKQEQVKRLIEEGVRVVLIDSLSNTEKLRAANIEQVAKVIKKVANMRVYLVIDNSMLGPGVDYRELWKLTNAKLEVIVWESLNKFFQYGMDLTMGGVIWSRGKMTEKLFDARMHAGTIMSEISCSMIPKQDYKMMKVYQARMERNKMILSEYLSNCVMAERKGFGGAQIVIPVNKTSSIKISYWVWKCIRETRRRGVQLAVGSSFGLPNTRIYLTARKTEYARMFLRISVGWECELAIREIGEGIRRVFELD